MQHIYGSAVVEERTTPTREHEIATYLRQEYEPGTGPGYLLAAASNGVARRGASPRERGGVVDAFVASVRRLVTRTRIRGPAHDEGDLI